jgi:hypothetical protein
MIDKFDKTVLEELRFFLKEINKREVLISEGRKEEYVPPNDALQIDVMYWHPNRTRHGEVDWLMKYIFKEEVSFTNKILNAFAVKFYGPAQAILNAINETEFSSKNLIDFERLPDDKDYQEWIRENLQRARDEKKEQWGTTELRTSLQTAAREYCGGAVGETDWANMIEWIASFKKDGLIDFYASRPTMEQAFKQLTSYRGIGNYYGYHANSNLARCYDISMNENEDFVIAGPGAHKTIEKLYPNQKKDKVSDMQILLYIRDNQDIIFNHEDVDRKALSQHLKPTQHVDYLTSFGCEITCCQFGVYQRFLEKPELINARKLEVNKEKKKEAAKDRERAAAQKAAGLLEF